MPLFRRILVANRGEIALRVIRTAQEMGIETVAVFSDADRMALHTRKANFAARLGGNTPAESYLDADKVLAIASSQDEMCNIFTAMGNGIKMMKLAKDLLDTGLLSQGEFEDLKVKLLRGD